MTIQTKYNIGDDIWYLKNNKAFHDVVVEISIMIGFDTEILYNLKFEPQSMCEHELASTKEELIEML